MKDLTVIVPVHEFNDTVLKECENSFAKLKEAIDAYTHGEVRTIAVGPDDVMSNRTFKRFIDNVGFKVQTIKNDGPTDYCSQVNLAVDSVETEHFSIMEFDDEYSPKWFNMAYDYFVGNESISVMIPVNAFHNEDDQNWEYGNTMALTAAFITDNENDTDPLGVLNEYRMEGSSMFNLTGAVFNTKDFIAVGKYKPSVEIAFNYEFLLRLTHKGLKAMVAPKEGYTHELGRKGSLGNMYMEKYNAKEIKKWFDLAERESRYTEDRGCSIESLNTTEALK